MHIRLHRHDDDDDQQNSYHNHMITRSSASMRALPLNMIKGDVSSCSQQYQPTSRYDSDQHHTMAQPMTLSYGLGHNSQEPSYGAPHDYKSQEVSTNVYSRDGMSQSQQDGDNRLGYEDNRDGNRPPNTNPSHENLNQLAQQGCKPYLNYNPISSNMGKIDLITKMLRFNGEGENVIEDYMDFKEEFCDYAKLEP